MAVLSEPDFGYLENSERVSGPHSPSLSLFQQSLRFMFHVVLRCGPRWYSRCSVDVGNISNLVTTDLKNVTDILGLETVCGDGGDDFVVLDIRDRGAAPAGYSARRRTPALTLSAKREIFEWIANTVKCDSGSQRCDPYLSRADHIYHLCQFVIKTVFMKQELRPSVAFSTMPVFDMLRNQLHNANYRFIQFVDAKVVFALPNQRLLVLDTELFNDRLPRYELYDGSATPSKHKFALYIDGELLFKRSCINFVLGPMRGSGNTSLLMALGGIALHTKASPYFFFARMGVPPHLARDRAAADARFVGRGGLMRDWSTQDRWSRCFGLYRPRTRFPSFSSSPHLISSSNALITLPGAPPIGPTQADIYKTNARMRRLVHRRRFSFDIYEFCELGKFHLNRDVHDLDFYHRPHVYLGTDKIRPACSSPHTR
ncbi:hypothetical protein C8R43DRAFT_1131888 [Mycena crocata]|nr:hypothetical protein C8R43DRAFT_1131888 [Mycena crocata]